MYIQHQGHSCFRFSDKDSSIIVDPFSKETGLRTPKIKDDMVLVSHGHFDHSNLEDVSEETVIINGPGEYEMKGIYIKGIPSYHDNSKGSERGLNTIYIVQMDGVSLCHMGDFGQDKLEEEQLEKIGDVDVLMIPVGGKYTIDGKQAVQISSQIEPKIIIPMHYKVSDLKIDIDGPEKFLKEVGLTPEKTDKLRVSQKTLPQEEIQLFMFT